MLTSLAVACSFLSSAGVQRSGIGSHIMMGSGVFGSRAFLLVRRLLERSLHRSGEQTMWKDLDSACSSVRLLTSSLILGVRYLKLRCSLDP